MTKEDLEKYDKAVLIKFIMSEVFFGRSYSEGKLDMLQRHYEVDCLLEKQKQLSEQMASIKFENAGQYKKWKRLYNQDIKMSERIDELLGI